MNGNLGLVAGLALLASATAGLLGHQMVAAGLGVIGIVFAVALGLSKRTKKQRSGEEPVSRGRRPMNNEGVNQSRIPEGDALHGHLRDATQKQLLALAELGVWMEKHHELLLAGRANGIRLGATQEVIQYMLDSLDPNLAGMVAGNLVQVPN